MKGIEASNTVNLNTEKASRKGLFFSQRESQTDYLLKLQSSFVSRVSRFFKKNLLFLSLFCLSLFLRIAMSGALDYEADQAQVFKLGIELLSSGKIPTHGALVVYTGTSLPGALQSLLAALPLWFTGWLPMGIAVFVAILNTLAQGILLWTCRRVFPKVDFFCLALFILFAPWTILFNGIWNPSFLPLFSALFFVGMLRVTQNPRDFWGSFLLPLSILSVVQLHLSFVVLVLGLFLSLVFRRIPLPRSLPGLLLGTFLGGLTLGPYLSERFSGASHKAFSFSDFFSSSGFLFPNLQFHFDHLVQWPAFFLRFLSFPTAEVSRFVGKYSGFGGFIQFVKVNPIWILPSVLGLGFSIGLVLLGLSFYAKQVHGREILRKAALLFSQGKVPHQGGRLSARSGNENDSNERISELFRWLAFTLPPVTGLLFAFSVTGPSAHTFWILLPLSFFPVLFALDELGLLGWVHAEELEVSPKSGSFFKSLARVRLFWIGYTAISLVFSLGTFLSVPRQTLARTQELAILVENGKLRLSEAPAAYIPFVSSLVKARETRRSTLGL